MKDLRQPDERKVVETYATNSAPRYKTMQDWHKANPGASLNFTPFDEGLAFITADMEREILDSLERAEDGFSLPHLTD